MSEAEVKVKKPEPLPMTTRFYSFIRGVAAIVTRTIYPVTFHETQHIQGRQAPYVLIANHQHWTDPVLIAVGVKKNQITYLAKKELVKNGFVDWFLRSLHIITVDRHNMDMNAIRSCSKLLRDGGILGIFPEGTRYHNGIMEEIEEGTSLLTMRANVPMVPAYIAGKARPFHRTHVYFSDPIAYDDLRAQGVNKETCEQLNQRIRDTYAQLQKEHPFVK